MKRLFKNAGKLNSEIISLTDATAEKCKTCKVYKKPNPRPIAGLSRATNFNQTVAMDLHQLSDNLWYFHMIDEFIRFSNAVIIKSKATPVVTKKFVQCWISFLGSPNRVFSDNGGEFESSKFKDMSENFNIKVVTTPAEVRWSNRICERHSHILTETVMKTKENVNCSWETALAWAINAKNSLININGFSPYQLVLGCNVSLLSVF